MTLVVILIVWAQGLSAVAQAQTSGIECDAFEKGDDGAWTVLRETEVPGPGRNIKIRPGSVLRPGAFILGTDVAEMLDKQCPAVPVTAPAPSPSTAPSPSQAAAPPAELQRQTDLSRFADANGNIDIKKLTCAQLTDIRYEDAEFLLTWHSGWSNGLVKRSAVNVPRLKEGIHDVVLHCRANKDKLLSQAIDFIVKQSRR